MESQFTQTLTRKPSSGQFFSGIDIDQMPETPQRGSHHRRTQSETLFRFPDDLFFEADLDFNLTGIDIPSISEENCDSRGNGAIPMAVDSCKSEESNDENSKGKLAGTSHYRSLSVGDDFFDGLGFQNSVVGGGGEGEKFGAKGFQERRMHRHSNSMDGFSSPFDAESIENEKKAMGPDRLAELALIDPKRAKRILANRQSAARSKERKIRYTSELERKVQTLQTEATTLSAQVTKLQRDTTGLTTENKELKLRLQALGQEAHLREALNDTLREEVQRLKIATGQIQAVGGNSFNRGLSPPFFSQAQPFNIHQTQQQQQQQQQQFLMSQSSDKARAQHGTRDFH